MYRLYFSREKATVCNNEVPVKRGLTVFSEVNFNLIVNKVNFREGVGLGACLRLSSCSLFLPIII